jgi:hypothetical protein
LIGGFASFCWVFAIGLEVSEWKGSEGGDFQSFFKADAIILEEFGDVFEALGKRQDAEIFGYWKEIAADLEAMLLAFFV